MQNNEFPKEITPRPADPHSDGRILVFEDDFNGDALDRTVWSHELGYIRNDELQVYTDSPKNVYLENGSLVLKAVREPAKAMKRGVMTDFEWTSGSIRTMGTFAAKYGRWEAKIRVPRAAGSFPAFWTLGAGFDYTSKGVNWPYCGEIDIFEHYPGTGDTSTHGAIYNPTPHLYRSIDIARARSKPLDYDEYHVYALEWTRDRMEFFVDGELVSAADISDEMTMFREPHFILLDHAVGAAGGSAEGAPDEMAMYVDWVRVYAPIEG